MPPPSTFSRAAFASATGLQPLRGVSWRRGRAGLAPWQRKKVDDANCVMDLCIQLFGAADPGKVVSALLFPEDFGRTRRGTPASTWRWLEVKALSQKGFDRGAVYQDEWATLPSPMPTGATTFFAFGEPCGLLPRMADFRRRWRIRRPTASQMACGVRELKQSPHG